MKKKVIYASGKITGTSDYETTLNGQPVVYSGSIDSLFPDTRSKNQKKKDRKEYFKRKRKMRGSITIEVLQ